MTDERPISDIVDVPKDYGKEVTAPAEAPAAESKPTPEADGGQPRGPDGKFLSKPSDEPQKAPDATGVKPAEPTPPVAPQVQQTRQPDPGFVPIGAVLDTREKLSASKAEIAELRRRLADFERQKEQPPVDFYADPEAAFNQRFSGALSPVQQQMKELENRTIRAEAMLIHGKDQVEKAQAAVKAALESNDPDMRALEMVCASSPDPFGEMIKWHERKSFDPAAHEAKIREDERQKVIAEFQKSTGQTAPQAAPVITPPSMASVAQGGVVPNAGGETNPANKFNDMFNR